MQAKLMHAEALHVHRHMLLLPFSMFLIIIFLLSSIFGLDK